MSGLKFARHFETAKMAPMTARRDSNSEDCQIRPRTVGLAERLFTTVNLAVFLALLSSVAVAAVLWELWH